jgi:uncharacterized protein YxjI
VGIRYRVAEQLALARDDFWVMNSLRRRVCQIDGTVLRQRDALVFRDSAGDTACRMRLPFDRRRDAIEVEGPDGRPLAKVTRTPVSPVWDRFVVTVGDGPGLAVQRNIRGHEYRVADVATVSKRWFRVRDTDGVAVGPGERSGHPGRDGRHRLTGGPCRLTGGA